MQRPLPSRSTAETVCDPLPTACPLPLCAQLPQLHNCHSTPNLCTHHPPRLSTRAVSCGVWVAACACGSTRTIRALCKSILLSFMSMLVSGSRFSTWTKGVGASPARQGRPLCLLAHVCVQAMLVHASRKSRVSTLYSLASRSYYKHRARVTLLVMPSILWCVWTCGVKLVLL